MWFCKKTPKNNKGCSPREILISINHQRQWLQFAGSGSNHLLVRFLWAVQSEMQKKLFDQPQWNVMRDRKWTEVENEAWIAVVLDLLVNPCRFRSYFWCGQNLFSLFKATLLTKETEVIVNRRYACWTANYTEVGTINTHENSKVESEARTISSEVFVENGLLILLKSISGIVIESDTSLELVDDIFSEESWSTFWWR